MSKTFTVRGVPDEVHAALVQEAELEHRSLSSLIVVILEAWSSGTPLAEAREGLQETKQHGPTQGMSLEETEAYYNRLMGR